MLQVGEGKNRITSWGEGESRRGIKAGDREVSQLFGREN